MERGRKCQNGASSVGTQDLEYPKCLVTQCAVQTRANSSTKLVHGSTDFPCGAHDSVGSRNSTSLLARACRSARGSIIGSRSPCYSELQYRYAWDNRCVCWRHAPCCLADISTSSARSFPLHLSISPNQVITPHKPKSRLAQSSRSAEVTWSRDEIEVQIAHHVSSTKGP